MPSPLNVGQARLFFFLFMTKVFSLFEQSINPRDMSVLVKFFEAVMIVAVLTFFPLDFQKYGGDGFPLEFLARRHWRIFV